jgi:hypothetical protein
MLFGRSPGYGRFIRTVMGQYRYGNDALITLACREQNIPLLTAHLVINPIVLTSTPGCGCWFR